MEENLVIKVRIEVDSVTIGNITIPTIIVNNDEKNN